MARGSSLSGMSMAELQREINRRGSVVKRLERKRAGLLAKLQALDAEIASHGGSMGRRGGTGMGAQTRAKNPMNLRDALAKLLNGKTMSVTEAAEEVQKAGYSTTSPNFRTMVNAALMNRKMFKRVSRGQYTAA